MDKMYAVTVSWYSEDPSDPGPFTDHLVATAASKADLCAMLGQYYGEDNIETISITSLNIEQPLLRISETAFNDIKENGEC